MQQQRRHGGNLHCFPNNSNAVPFVLEVAHDDAVAWAYAEKHADHVRCLVGLAGGA